MLAQVVAQYGSEAQSGWLAEAEASLGSPAQPTKLRIAIARAARKLGSDQVALTETERAALPEGPAYQQWCLWDFGRASLVLRACASLPESQHVELVEPLLRRGEQGEQVSLLRMASILPGPARFVDVAVDLCRTNSVDVFEAIACDNPFVRDHFPERNYNQVVLKAVFMEVAVGRIVGLAQRVNNEMVRMANDFGDERSAAGRVVPQDIQHITELAKAKST